VIRPNFLSLSIGLPCFTSPIAIQDGGSCTHFAVNKIFRVYRHFELGYVTVVHGTP